MVIRTPAPASGGFQVLKGQRGQRSGRYSDEQRSIHASAPRRHIFGHRPGAVPVTAAGGLTFEDGISDAGKYVEMVAHTDTIALISNCPQLNNPCNAYNPTPIEVLIWPAE